VISQDGWSRMDEGDYFAPPYPKRGVRRCKISTFISHTIPLHPEHSVSHAGRNRLESCNILLRTRETFLRTRRIGGEVDRGIKVNTGALVTAKDIGIVNRSRYADATSGTLIVMSQGEGDVLQLVGVHAILVNNGNSMHGP